MKPWLEQDVDVVRDTALKTACVRLRRCHLSHCSCQAAPVRRRSNQAGTRRRRRRREIFLANSYCPLLYSPRPHQQPGKPLRVNLAVEPLWVKQLVRRQQGHLRAVDIHSHRQCQRRHCRRRICRLHRSSNGSKSAIANNGRRQSGRVTRIIAPRSIFRGSSITIFRQSSS